MGKIYKTQIKIHDEKDPDKMKKYEEDVLKIYRFYKDHIGKEPKFSFTEGIEKFILNVKWQSERGMVRVRFNFEPERVVDRQIVGDDSSKKYEKFSTLELKFFDGVNFELHPVYNQKLKQDVKDWFGENKAEDMLGNPMAKETKAEDDRYKPTRLEAEAVIRAALKINHVINDTGDTFSLIHEFRKDKLPRNQVNVDLNKQTYTILEMHKDGSSTEVVPDFGDYMLLRRVGLECTHPDVKEYYGTHETFDTWFNKNRYVFWEQTGHGAKYYKIYDSDGNGWMISIDHNFKTVAKFNGAENNTGGFIVYDYEPFSKEELEYFDSKNYNLDRRHQRSTEQEMNDWF